MMTKTELLERLEATATEVDRQSTWPQQQLEWLTNTDVLRTVIPREYGGIEESAEYLTHEYHDLARACLTTCFVLTQRNGACQRIAGSSNSELKRELLPGLATGELFATVGISHLTTSRQFLKTPAVQAQLSPTTITLNGQIPWVTGASAADWIITGGTCDDGKQILVAVPGEHPGLTVQPYVQLMAMTASETASVGLDSVTLPLDNLLAGPSEAVLSSGTGGGAGSVTTSTLALGLIARMVELIEDQSSFREELREAATLFKSEYESLSRDLFSSVLADSTSQDLNNRPELSAASIRQRANSLVLRITQAALTMTKGAGYVKGHLVELAVREAMFFLVWSCPQSVAQGVLNELVCRDVTFAPSDI